jgi:hypothetical protein
LILYDKFLESENHFSELGEATFLALSFLVHFRGSLLRISQESLLLILQRFGTTPLILPKNQELGAVPNGALVL